MLKNLRICMVTCQFPPKCAGIGNQVYALSKALVKRGHLVTVLTRGKLFREPERHIEGINVIELPFIALPPPLHMIFHGYFVNKKLNELQNDFDIVHLHTPLVPRIVVSLPKVVQVHSLWIEETKYFKGAKDKYSLAVRTFKNQVINSEKITLEQANSIITYSEYENKLLQLYKLNLCRVHIINGSINSEFASIVKTTKKYDIIFVGRLNPRKGVDEIIQAVKYISQVIPTVQCLIIGSGSSKRKMEVEVKKLNLRDNFTFLGFVPNKEISTYLAQSRVCVVPSRYEPFGIVTGEAMTIGLPVVGTRVGGTESMVLDGETGYLVNVGDYQSLAEKVIYLLQHPQKAAQLGHKGSIRIKKYFSENSMIEKIQSLYMELI